MAATKETPTPTTATPTTATATTATTAVAGEAVLAARYRREITRSAERTYRRVVREFGRDAGCTEEQAKMWLQNAGISEPKNGGK
jgi:hypothetical protein